MKKKKRRKSLVSEVMSRFARLGGNARKKKYGKKQLSEWASLGAPAREAKKLGITVEEYLLRQKKTA